MLTRYDYVVGTIVDHLEDSGLNEHVASFKENVVSVNEKTIATVKFTVIELRKTFRDYLLIGFLKHHEDNILITFDNKKLY